MYKMVNKANGGEHFVDEDVYQKMKKRGHLKNYTVTEVPDSTKAGKFYPPEVKSMMELKNKQQPPAPDPLIDKPAATETKTPPPRVRRIKPAHHRNNDEKK